MKKIFVSLLTLFCIACSGQNLHFAFSPANDSSYSRGKAVAYDQNGDLITSGTYSGTIDFDPGSGNYLLNLPSASVPTSYLAKYDSNNSLSWCFTLGNDSACASVYTIATDAANNIFITGVCDSAQIDFDPGPGQTFLNPVWQGEVFLAKYDPAGNLIWVFNIGNTNTGTQPSGLACDQNGNICMTGTFAGNLDLDPDAAVSMIATNSYTSVFLVSYDVNGNYRWGFAIGNLSANTVARAPSVAPNNDIVISGNLSDTIDFDPGAATANLVESGNGDLFVARYDSNGNYLWAFSIGGPVSTKVVAADNTGAVIITGVLSGTGVDFDPGAGSFPMSIVSSGGDIFVAKYSSSGNFIWAFQFSPQTGYLNPVAILTDAAGNIILSGDFVGGGLDFDPGPANFTESSLDHDLFVARYTGGGQFLDMFHVGATSSGIFFVKGAAMDNNGTVAATGFLIGQRIDFDPGSGVTNIGSQQSVSSAILVSYSWLAGMPGNPDDDFFLLWPNPSSGELNVLLPENYTPDGSEKLTVTDAAGKLVLEKTNLSAGKNTIQLQAFANGVYFVSFRSSHFSRTEKILLKN